MMFDSNHSPDWVPNMDGPFAEELAAYIRHKRALGYQYAEPVCYTLKKMDRTFTEMGCDGTRITHEIQECRSSEGGRIRSGSAPSSRGLFHGRRPCTPSFSPCPIMLT